MNKFFAFALCLVLAPLQVLASAPDAVLEQAAALHLAGSAHWLRLLHFPPASSHSEILSPDFFLAPDGERSAESELRASIQGWYEPASLADQHPRCRFPARYLWLDQQLQLSDLDDVPPRCAKFADWAKPAQIKSLSLLMVSGYLGNPSSSFGHVLLKLNQGDASDDARLLDLSFNFGALVPPGETALVYIFRGLFGGYQAGFSDTPFYAQDQVYTHTEFRDIWEYRLALTPLEQQTVIAHLWEIIGKKFDYFFLTKNCGYRLGELLSLATGQDYTPHSTLWFAPVELFHALLRDSALDHAPLVADIRFIPSSERVLYRNFSQLHPEELLTANHLIQNPAVDLAAELTRIAPDRQADFLQAMLAYYEYRLAAAGEHPPREMVLAKDAALRLRFHLPPGHVAPLSVENLPPPTAGHALSLLAAGAEYVNGESRGLVRFSTYYDDVLNDPGGGQKELVTLDAQLSLDSRARGRLDFIDLIRVRKQRTDQIGIAGEDRRSWQIRLGLGHGLSGARPLAAEFSGGMGRSMELAPHVIGYAMLDAELRGASDVLAIQPNAGLSARWGFSHTLLRAIESYDVRAADWRFGWQFENRLTLSHRFEAAAIWQGTHADSDIRLVLNSYW